MGDFKMSRRYSTKTLEDIMGKYDEKVLHISRFKFIIMEPINTSRKSIDDKPIDSHDKWKDARAHLKLLNHNRRSGFFYVKIQCKNIDEGD